MKTNTPHITITLRFGYKGATRTVINAVTKITASGDQTLVGFEVSKDEELTGAVKAYRVDRIEEILSAQAKVTA